VTRIENAASRPETGAYAFSRLQPDDGRSAAEHHMALRLTAGRRPTARPKVCRK